MFGVCMFVFMFPHQQHMCVVGCVFSGAAFHCVCVCVCARV